MNPLHRRRTQAEYTPGGGPNGARRPYLAPTITVLGNVHSLTAGPAGGSEDNSTSGSGT